MKIGIVTDIHSNKIALKAVLQEFQKRKIDKIICCGDIIGIGPHPEETMQLLMQNKDKFIAVRGNHEQYLLAGLPKKVHDDKRGMSLEEIENHKWTHSQLSQKSKEFIKNIPIYQNIEIEGKKIYVVHYPTNEKGEYKKHIKNADIKENKELFSNINADIHIYGHTHAVSINNEINKWYINTGSLGCPMSSNMANCGILTIEDDKIDLETLSIEYNVREVIREINKIKFPFYEKILKIFFGKNS